MSALFRLAFRELWNSWSFSLFFALNLSVGLVGLLTVDSLRLSLSDVLSQKSRTMLGADLSVSVRRSFSPEEITQIESALPKNASFVKATDVLTMLDGGGTSRLVSVRAVQPAYPWYGEIVLEKNGRLGPGAIAKLAGSNRLWIDRDTAKDLELALGQAVKIGGMDFLIDDFILDDSTSSVMSSRFAPRVYLDRDKLSETSLLQFGSTQRQRYLIATADSSKVKTALEQVLEDAAISVNTHEDAAEGIARLFSFLSDYLGLVSLTALILASLGVLYQFRRFFLSKSRSVALLLAVGATPLRVAGLFVIEISVLSLGAALIATVGAWLLVPVFGELVKGFAPSDFSASLQWQIGIKALAFGLFGSLLLCLPQLGALFRFSPAALFQEESSWQIQRAPVAYYLPSFFFIAALSVWTAKSFLVGGVFIGVLFLSSAVLALGGYLGLWGLGSIVATRSLTLRLAVRHLLRSRSATVLGLFSIGLSAMLVSLIPQLRAGIAAELADSQASPKPSLFLFDIQDNQLAPLEQGLRELGVEMEGSSALVRARLKSVNGVAADRDTEKGAFDTRERERERAFRNRGFNLSYRQTLSEAETILEGLPFDGPYQEGAGQWPKISVDSDFAKELDWKLGDRIEFIVLGETVRAQVHNLRKVRWTSFRPNFFVQFQAGVLEGFPKTFVATLPSLKDEKRRAVQNYVVRYFPNVSAIGVASLIEKILELSSRISWILLVMAGWTAFAGLLTLYSMGRFEAYSRRWEMQLLKVLGALSGTVSRIFVWESFLLSVCSVSLGVGASLLSSYLLSTFALKSPWAVDLPAALILWVSCVVFSVVAVLIASWRTWLVAPLGILKDAQ